MTADILSDTKQANDSGRNIFKILNLNVFYYVA